MYDELDEFEVKYKKRTKKTSNPRSKHKHTYELCFLKFGYKHPCTLKTEDRLDLAEYCTQCGKIRDIPFFCSRDDFLAKLGKTENEDICSSSWV